MTRKILLLAGLVFTAAFLRLVPHAPNFTPLGAMGLFGAAYFRRSWGLLLPFIALFLSDLVLNNVVYQEYYPNFTLFTSGWTYLAFGAVVLVGLGVFNSKISFTRVGLGSLAASVAFFLVSNLSTFLETGLYPKNFAGLMACYTAGLPFFPNTLLSDLLYSGVLFGAYALMTKNLPELATRRIS